MSKLLEERLKHPERSFKFDREKDQLRIENRQTGRGITIELPGIIAKWQQQNEKAIEETVYYVVEGLRAMEDEVQLLGQERNIFPVIRSTSFPNEAEEGVPFFFDELYGRNTYLLCVRPGKDLPAN